MQTTLFGAPPVIHAPKIKPVKSSSNQTLPIKLPTNITGRTFLTNTGQWFNVSKINANIIQKHSINPYYNIKRNSIASSCFNGEPKIIIRNPDGEEDEELTRFARNMMQNLTDWNTGMPVSSYQYAQLALLEIFDGGAALFEPVWGNAGGWLYLYALKPLPWTTFKDLPDGFEDSPSALLKGIVIGPDGKIQYHQYQDDDAWHPIENVLHIKNPQSRDLAGDPLCLPLIPLIEMLNFCWDLNRMKDTRVGAPSIFVEMLSNDDDTLAIANDIITNWGSKTQFAHSEHIRVYNLSESGTGINTVLESIKALEEIFDAIYNPALQVQNQGTRLGGNDAGAERLLYAQANTFLSWLDLGFTSLLKKWLIGNMFTGYTAEYCLPKLEPDKSAANREEAKIGFETKSLTLDERRRRLGEGPATEEQKAEIAMEYQASSLFDATLPPVIQNTAASNDKMESELAKKVAMKILNSEDEFERAIYQAVGVNPA